MYLTVRESCNIITLPVHMKIWWLNSSTANWKVLAAGYSQIVKYVFEPSV